jgi:two-component system, NtrC family, response regulator AtoC
VTRRSHRDGTPITRVEDLPAAGASGLRIVAIGEGLLDSRPLPPAGQVTIGRSSRCDISLDHDSLSRTHALLHVGARLELEDCGSKNGTSVAGVRLEAGRRVPLQIGQVVTLGSVTLLVQHGGGPPAQLADRPPAAAPAPAGRAASDAIIVDPAMRALYDLVARVAPVDIHVLILGETGVGKDLLAQAIHGGSGRAQKPLLRLNCAAMPEPLIESELFGYERGAFTGATQAKPGLFEQADGGTVFLDEIGELPAGTQAKLLRVIEDRTFMRVGGLRAQTSDLRFVCATNRDLAADVAAGRFREDLFFRLEGIVLTVPPLRERRGEILALAERFAKDAVRKLPRKPASGGAIAPAAQRKLLEHDWPGNVRELRNVIERAVVLSAAGAILPEHIQFAPRGSAGGTDAVRAAPASAASLRTQVQDLERERILAALEECGGNQTRAARRLGMRRGTLISRLDEYQIQRPRKRDRD